jgi:hypothetical protein
MGLRYLGVGIMIPLSASTMATSAQQLIGVAEYKVESPMAKTSTSGKKENPL